MTMPKSFFTGRAHLADIWLIRQFSQAKAKAKAEASPDPGPMPRVRGKAYG